MKYFKSICQSVSDQKAAVNMPAGMEEQEKPTGLRHLLPSWHILLRAHALQKNPETQEAFPENKETGLNCQLGDISRYQTPQKLAPSSTRHL